MGDERYSAAELRRFCAGVFAALGLPEEDARTAADSLIRAELEGAGSHGISRLPIYAKRIREGRIAAKPDIRLQPSGAVLQVDGGNGLGQVVASRALREAIPMAREYGIAGAAIRGSNHFGTAAYYCQLACAANMALIAMTNSPPGIPPWGGKRAYFGTNPIAFGFPAKGRPPVIVDMSSSVVARGKIILAEKLGHAIPPDWAIDAEGKATTDPAAALGGAVLPLGGAKGYALALAVEMICGVLSGAAFGTHVNNLYRDGDPPAEVGHCFIVLDIAKWLPLPAYFARVDELLREVKETPRAHGVAEILIPGERRARTRADNEARGVPLSAEIRDELVRLSVEHGVPFPKG